MEDHAVELYFDKVHHFKDEILFLRSIALKTLPEEALKWGSPTYIYKGKLIATIAEFKTYCGLWFHYGSLMSDPLNVFVSGKENQTKVMRQWRFSSIQEINDNDITSYLLEAMALVDQGAKIPKQLNQTLAIPPELENILNENSSIKTAWDSFSLSCKREYAEYISSAKREETKMRRIEKIIPMILEKKGINDAYKR